MAKVAVKLGGEGEAISDARIAPRVVLVNCIHTVGEGTASSVGRVIKLLGLLKSNGDDGDGVHSADTLIRERVHANMLKEDIVRTAGSNEARRVL